MSEQGKELADVDFPVIAMPWEELKQYAASCDDFWKSNLLDNMRIKFDGLLSDLNRSANLSVYSWLEQYVGDDKLLDELTEARSKLRSSAERFADLAKVNDPGATALLLHEVGRIAEASFRLGVLDRGSVISRLRNQSDTQRASLERQSIASSRRKRLTKAVVALLAECPECAPRPATILRRLRESHPAELFEKKSRSTLIRDIEKIISGQKSAAAVTE